MSLLIRFWRDERAGATIEYGLIVMGISIAIVGWTLKGIEPNSIGTLF